jgi:hypothetical protein
MASAAALRQALLVRRLARTGPLSATIGHLRSESHHQRRELAAFIPLQIGPVKYARLQLNSLELIAVVGELKMALPVGGHGNWRKELIGPLVIGMIQWEVWVLGCSVRLPTEGLGLCVAEGGGKGPVRGEHR